MAPIKQVADCQTSPHLCITKQGLELTAKVFLWIVFTLLPCQFIIGLGVVLWYRRSDRLKKAQEKKID